MHRCSGLWTLRWYEFGMPISRGPAGGHKSQERGFLLSSVARLETGSRRGAEAGVLFRPTPRVGGRVLPLDCPRLVHSHLRFQASLNSSSPSGKCPPAPRRLPLRVPSSPASSLPSEKTPLTFYAALPPPAGARAGNQVPSLPETASGLCVMSKILGAGRAAPPGPGAGEGRQGDASARCR